MRILRHFRDSPTAARGGVVAIGNFDGVHLGHRAVIAEAGRIAAERNVAHVVLTFEPHPRSIFRPDAPPFRLTPLRQKARHIAALGVDYLLVLRFDAAFARQSADDFVQDVLVGRMGVRHVVVGEDFHFGRDRKGDADFLKGCAGDYGFDVTAVAPVRNGGGEICSSTEIRARLGKGDVAAAARFLGHPWEVEGRIERGDQRGRTLGFPTANLRLGAQILPATGVYAVRVGVKSGTGVTWHDGVANLGRRPTFDDRGILLEVNLFDFDGDLYDRYLRVALIDYIRPERKFDGLDRLKAQIADDSARARTLLDEVPAPASYTVLE